VRVGSPGRRRREGRRCGVFPPLLRTLDRIRVDFRRIVLVTGQPRDLCPRLPPHLISQRDRGPQPWIGWRPRSGREVKPGMGTWSRSVGVNPTPDPHPPPRRPRG
jgi:hypothetical protein